MDKPIIINVSLLCESILLISGACDGLIDQIVL